MQIDLILFSTRKKSNYQKQKMLFHPPKIQKRIFKKKLLKF